MANVGKVIALSLVACAATLSSEAATWYVAAPPSGDNGNPGTLEEPFATIWKGMNSAAEGDSVVVAEGTYVENIDFKGKNILLHSADPFNPDVVARTIIDGNQVGSVVRFAAGENQNCLLWGFTIRNGFDPSGSGIFCSNSSPWIEGNTITGNGARGSVAAIYCQADSSPSIYCNTIEGNSGDGIYCAGSSPTVYYNTIEGNIGDGIYCAGSSPTVYYNTIEGNIGSGIYCYVSSPTISGNAITGNSAGWRGGGIYCYYSSPTITNNTIAGNSAAQDGGGIHCQGSYPTITNNTIAGNSAGWGGGIHCHGSSPTITNNTIAGNSAAQEGGGIHCHGSYPTITNNTIASNSAAEKGGGIYCESCSRVTIANTVIAFNSSGAGIYWSSGTVTLSHNCVYNPGGYDYEGVHNPTGTDGNISCDPLFVRNPHPGPDGVWGSDDDDYGDLRLRLGSLCINGGDDSAVPADVTTDLAGNPRIAGGAVDIGGIEVPSVMTFETTWRQSTVDIGLAAQYGSLTDGSVGGDFTGTFDLTQFQMATIASGPFAGQGFFQAKWAATLDGIDCWGGWEGVCQVKSSEGKVYLKGGVVEADVDGIAEATLTESSAGTGIFDHCQGTWRLGRLGGQVVSATLALDGVLAYEEPLEEAATRAHLLQAALEGIGPGGRDEGLSVVLTHLRVDDANSPFDGEGFSIISYSSKRGSGEGWTHDSLVFPGIVEMKGLFSGASEGAVSGTLDEAGTPRSLSLTLHRVDLGLPAAADLDVTTSGPTRVSPGQTVDFVIEYTNRGLKTAENVVVVDRLSPAVEYVSCTGDGIYRPGLHEVFWKAGNLAPGQAGRVSVRVQIQWGLAQGVELLNTALISTTSPERDLIENPEMPPPFDVSEYLAYPVVQATEYVSAEELETTLLSDPGFAEAYNSLIQRGYQYSNLAAICTFADGTSLKMAMMSNPASPDQTCAVIQHETDKVLIMKADENIASFGGQDGEVVYDFTDPDVLRISSSGASSTTGGCGIEDCINNCLLGKLPLHLLKKIYSAVSAAAGCKDCAVCAATQEKYACAKCANALSKAVASVPGAGEIISISQCAEKCVDNPDLYSGEPGQTRFVCRQGPGGVWEWVKALPGTDLMEWITMPEEGYYVAEYFWYEEQCRWVFSVSTYCEKCQVCSSGSCVWGEETNANKKEQEITTARDPNVKYGPEGDVLPGQGLTYRVEYANEGEGIAFGVYFTDTLDEDLDDWTVQIGPVISTKDGSQIAPAGSYDLTTRTITWFVGEVGPGEGGYADFSVTVRGDAPGGTEIINYATVYFPSVPEVTRTNGIVSVVPLGKGGIAGLQRSGTNLTIAWDAFGDGQYTVQTASDLSSGAWVDTPGRWVGERCYELDVGELRGLFIRVKAGAP